LVERARGLMDKVNVLPGDLNTAAGLLEQAAKLAPNDALVWATWAQLDLVYVALDFDNTPSRHNAARAHIAQANALDPASRETRYTQAEVMRSLAWDSDTQAAAEKILRPMLTEAPEDGRVLIQLGWVAFAQGRMDDAVALFDRAALLPAFAIEATYCKALVLVLRNRFGDASRASDQLLVLAPTHAFALCQKAWLSVGWHEDPQAAREYIERIPPQMRVEDMSAYFAYHVYMSRREYDQAVQAIRAVPRDYLSAQPGPGPSGFYIGDALAAAGKSAAAEIEWRRGLATVERRLAEAPSDETLMKFKALLLARLGDRVAAERVWKAVVELHGDKAWGGLAAPLHIEFLPPEEAIAWLNGRLKEPQLWFTAAALRLNPVYDPLRANPKFTALIEKMDADPRLSPKAKPASAPSPISQLPSPSDQPKVDQKSVAVLPFANLSGDKEQEYFSDGLTEEILNTLARERDLRVPGRASSFSFKGKNASSAEIAKALNVSRLVEGSVRKAGNKVRISVSLTRASDGFSEELGTFTEELSDVFALQEKVARAVVEKLTQRTVATVSVGLTRDAAAYDAYLKGRALQTRAADTRAEAIAFYEQAVALDPKFALAWARLAEARFRTFGFFDSSPAVVQGTREAIERALATQPDLPEALIMRANWRRGVEEDYAGAERDLARVESLRPPTADLRYAQAMLARDLSRFDEAFRFYREAMLLDPQNGDFTNAYAVSFCMPRGEFVEADQLFRRAMTIQAPNSIIPFNNLINLRQAWRGPEAALRLLDRFPPTQAGWRSRRLNLLIVLGRLDEARALAAELEGSLAPAVSLITFGPQDRPDLGQLMALGLTDLVQARARQVVADASREFARGNRARRFRTLFIRAEIALGNRDSARAELEEWRAEAQRIKSDYRRYTDFTSGAFPLYALLGDADTVVALLQELRASGFIASDHLAHSPDYAAVRNDSRFQELVRQYNDWTKALPDPTDL
ncbi:MAG: hypothetical protein QG602_3483, partial [Verrucomicrobiota bacterium]|nr:hypothetical protein [Verrucomicrobiota bacterium]